MRASAFLTLELDKWRQVSRIFNAALEVEAAQRLAFVENECAGDAELKAEVEALISAHDSFDSFIDSPEAGLIAKQGNRQKLETGANIGSFQILAFIAAGGMGEVYLAEDTRLQRRVALKLLPAEFIHNTELMRRFQQEAKAASALNHPNIITVFEVDFSEEHPFIATEFVEGETLRTKISRGKIELPEALRMATQIASSLQIAHKAEIIHRDIKPENIMLRHSDKLVKILDFGLAKPTRKFLDEETLLKTAPGLVLGTVAYMSPEQTRGKDVDQRTDIWSFGVVLYEMLTGEKPFSGTTPSHLIVKILDEQPTTKNLPENLREIVERCLEKNSDKRFQDFDEIVPLLQNFQQEISLREFQSAPQSRKNSFAKIALASILFIVFATAGFALYRYFSNQNAPDSFERAKLSRLTTSGKERLAVISPDGKYIAHVSENEGKQSLNLRQTNAANSREIIAPAPIQFLGLTFSPDGESLYYSIFSDEKTPRALYRVQTLGGEPRKVLENVSSQISFSPKGDKFTFIRNSKDDGDVIFLANTDGSGTPEKIASRQLPDFLTGTPVWSPDGKTIICPASSLSGSVDYKVLAFDVETKKETVLTKERWTIIHHLAWLPDAKSFLMTARERDGQPFQIWQVSAGDGKISRITNDLNDYETVSLATNSNSIVAVRKDEQANLWATENFGEKPVEEASLKQITSDDATKDGIAGLTQTFDGKIVFTSVAADGEAIWMLNTDGSNRRQITTESGVFVALSVSEKGQLAYFLKESSGGSFWLLNLADGTRQKIDRDSMAQFQFFPYLAPKENWLAYIGVSSTTGNYTLRKISLEAGATPIELTNYNAGLPKISPDEKSIAFNFQNNQAGGVWQIGVIPSEGGKVTPLPVYGNASTSHEWTTDSKAILAIRTENGISNIWRYPIDGSKETKLTNFTKDTIFNLDLSPDSKRLILSRGTSKSDVILIRKEEEVRHKIHENLTLFFVCFVFL